MGDIIHLLPDSLANQIAAGEVIQRPASVVKELLENSLDANATHIRLILKDSGKTLIQVVDDGDGMSETDARMSFERHATSKIQSSEDLFRIHSFGFRGEALASIAAVAHVDLKTKQENLNIGSQILIQGSRVKKQEPVQTPSGTSIAVRHLFFNVPARRKFLKSDPVELKHIMEEFARIAIPNPDIFFSVHHNGNELYHFAPSNLRMRLVNYFGKNTNEKIIPVEEQTDFARITGFVGRPEFIKKSRGDQYIFVNRRFIRSNYLGHAVKMAYENLIPDQHFPFYVLLLEVDPSAIDVNIHPTKQEIKFENERLIYNLTRVAVRHALGKYSVAPTIDFENAILTQQVLSNQPQQRFRSSPSGTRKEREEWNNLYRQLQEEAPSDLEAGTSITLSSNWKTDSGKETQLEEGDEKNCFQVHSSYIISPIKSGVVVIDQQAAHERILYERYLLSLKERKVASQRSLFPETIRLNTQNARILEDLLNDLNYLGFRIEKFGDQTFILNSVPAEGLTEDPVRFIENFIESYSANLEVELGIHENIARSMAQNSCINKGKKLHPHEMSELVDQLFACQMPYAGPSGRKCFITFGLDELQNRFNTK